MSAKSKSTTQYITPKKGRGWLQQRFEGADYIRALVELLKNCFDWGATRIDLVTADHNTLVVVDNGVGMDEKNRTAFCSISASTAGEEQQGRFCTGSKQMLIEHSSTVLVRTVAQNDPNTVYRFVLDTRTYENMLDAGMGIEVEVLPRTKANWPYESATGTELTYFLKRPDSKSVLRGNALAKRLAGRLPALVREFLFVDGSKVPAKKIAGKMYNEVRQLGNLGELHINLYQPVTRGLEDGLFAGTGTIPDVRFRDLATLARQHGYSVPEVFLHLRICGIVSLPLFKKYEREDRQGFSPSILDDKGLGLLLAYLEEIAEKVEETLELTSRKSGKTPVVNQLAKLTNSVFNPTHVQPPNLTWQEPEDMEIVEVDDKSRPEKVIHLRIHRPEVEVGEIVEVQARIASGFETKYDLTRINWTTDEALGVSFTDKIPGVLKFKAKHVGRGRVSASIPRAGHTSKILFDVLPAGQRKFKLKAPLTVHAGEKVVINILNEDKIKGRVKWAYAGLAGELEESSDGLKATFTASREGIVTVYANDASSSVKAECQLTVLPPRLERPLICINGIYFDVLEQPFEGGLIQIIQGNPGANVHLLYLNSDNEVYRQADEAGQLTLVLLQAVCMQYGEFMVHAIGESPWADESARMRAGAVGTSVFAKLLASMK